MRPKPSGVTSSRLTSSVGTSDQSMSRSSSEMSVCWRSPVSSSSRSSSSSLRSRASSSSRSSMSVGSSIENTRKSPWSSISTEAWRDAPGVFLYAARSASSRAATSAPSSIPLSRSISRTASRISWLISRSLVDQVGPHDLGIRDLGFGPVRGGDLHALLARGENLAAQLSCGGAKLDVAPQRRLEVLLPPQRPVQSRGRDLDAVLTQVVAQDVGDTRAQGMVDAPRLVDVDPEARRGQELDREDVHARQLLLDLRCDLYLQLALLLECRRHLRSSLSQKMGPQAHFSDPVKCGRSSVATAPQPPAAR